eukprot:TRINITY_DN149_c0_g1_i1.p2 TRINITY_DN149_c0_g1~~TRINITY_DN149_c0_g1_i1.p2  ORF type:complete len:168 (-),score=66.99 TRINITY_DN149_c0_g1_i1:241-744(-)
MTRRIVLAVDGDTPQAVELIEWAAENLAIRPTKAPAADDVAPPEVHVTILYVTLPPQLPDWGFHALFTGDKRWEEILVENQKRAAQAAVNLRELATRLDLPAGVETRPGDPRDVIAKYVKADGTDLLVVGSRGLSSAAGMLMGSVSSHLVAHAGCSVVVYRGGKAAA